MSIQSRRERLRRLVGMAREEIDEKGEFTLQGPAATQIIDDIEIFCDITIKPDAALANRVEALGTRWQAAANRQKESIDRLLDHMSGLKATIHRISESSELSDSEKIEAIKEILH